MPLDILNWIDSFDPNVSTFWLHGSAKKGKSSIARTIVLWSENVGILYSHCCFDRDRAAEHQEEKMMTTVALADRDPTGRQALADTIAKDRSLKASPDLIRRGRSSFLSRCLVFQAE